MKAIALAMNLKSLLLNSSESGMGYQLVEATTAGGERKEGIVYNGDLMLLGNGAQARVGLSAYESLKASAVSSIGEIRDVTVVPKVTHARSVMENASPADTSGPAKEAPVERTKFGEVFKRFSAYKKDNRVLDDGRLRPGTYATTEADARNVRTGNEAVARYALPNRDPASYVFTSEPTANTQIQRGTVAPAFEQPGGGVEVIFPEGTQANTTTGPIKIPD